MHKNRQASSIRRLAALSLATLNPASALAGQTALDLHAGYRNDQLQWSIADPINNIDILSELSWRDLRMAAVGADLRHQTSTSFMLLARADYAYATSGHVQDSDYWQSGRQNEFSRSTGSAHGSQAFGIVAGVGLPFTKELDSWQLQLMPMLGLSSQHQRLRYRDGTQELVYSGSPTSLGPINGLNTRYDSRWNSAWAGLELVLQKRGDISLRARAERHVADYSAKANWNLRTDFAHPVSFRQWASAQAQVFTLEARYAYANAYLTAQVSQHTWKTSRGTDRIYLADGSMQYTPLNGVRWTSNRLSLGVGLDF